MDSSPNDFFRTTIGFPDITTIECPRGAPLYYHDAAALRVHPPHVGPKVPYLCDELVPRVHNAICAAAHQYGDVTCFDALYHSLRQHDHDYDGAGDCAYFLPPKATDSSSPAPSTFSTPSTCSSSSTSLPPFWTPSPDALHFQPIENGTQDHDAFLGLEASQLSPMAAHLLLPDDLTSGIPIGNTPSVVARLSPSSVLAAAQFDCYNPRVDSALSLTCASPALLCLSPTKDSSRAKAPTFVCAPECSPSAVALRSVVSSLVIDRNSTTAGPTANTMEATHAIALNPTSTPNGSHMELTAHIINPDSSRSLASKAADTAPNHITTTTTTNIDAQSSPADRAAERPIVPLRRKRESSKSSKADGGGRAHARTSARTSPSASSVTTSVFRVAPPSLSPLPSCFSRDAPDPVMHPEEPASLIAVTTPLVQDLAAIDTIDRSNHRRSRRPKRHISYEEMEMDDDAPAPKRTKKSSSSTSASHPRPRPRYSRTSSSSSSSSSGTLPCPIKGCPVLCTRPSDLKRHLLTATVHVTEYQAMRNLELMCRKCERFMARVDSRVRHELLDACGKRTFHRAPAIPALIVRREDWAQVPPLRFLNETFE
ncbi:hypothetical protein DXG03_004658 [Asterophora parasitica]|uniref:Uncharacterized protein n=1 Tax=Asterophora parasitica TaxID=117018 RepID=A0A9P7K7S8_9AGAR|nr:hypothetical protein DXG03_004658 [Asterophora parasitica]